MCITFTYQRYGVYYFVRRVPADIRHHYSSNRIAFSLKTKSAKTAAKASEAYKVKLDEFWQKLRIQDNDVPAAHLLVEVRGNPKSELPNILVAKDMYLRLKGKNKGVVFHRTANRNIDYVIECLGSKSIDQYTVSVASDLHQYHPAMLFVYFSNGLIYFITRSTNIG